MHSQAYLNMALSKQRKLRRSADFEFHVYFDGGTLGKNGKCQDGYGSWEVVFNRFSKRCERQKYLAIGVGHRVTNNVAEWLSLKCALMWLETVREKHHYSINIYGDSQLVLNLLAGKWKTKNVNMAELRDHCLHYLKGFRSWRTAWNRRQANVNRFGH